MPCSFVQQTNLPVNDHLIAFIDPSPEWRIISFPAFDPNPIEPSQPDAAAAALFVFALALTPILPPLVNIKLPANPPET
jgi:hypothetical protein